MTLENVDLSTLAVTFSYWSVPSAFGGNLSLEEQEMLPGVTNTSSVVIQQLGKFQLHTEPHQVFLKQLFLLFSLFFFSTYKPLFGIYGNTKNVKTCLLQLNQAALET